MDTHHPSRSSALAGAVVVLSDLASPLGGAIARRLASQTGSLILASRQAQAARTVLAEIERIRMMSGQYGQLILRQIDASREDGARLLLQLPREVQLTADAVIHVAPPDRRDPANALAPLLPMLRHSCEELSRQDNGRVVLVLDLTQPSASAFSAGARRRMDATFETLIRTTASANYSRDLCVNGLIVQEAESNVDCAFALATGESQSNGASRNGSADVHAAAASVVELLASASSCGITGQVFRIGGRPERSARSAEAASSLGAPGQI